MTDRKIDPQKAAEIDDLTHKINTGMQTPETMGRILIHSLLAQASSKGTLAADGSIDIPMSATIRLPGAKGIAASSDCGECCITILGTRVVCGLVCHHET